MKDAELGWRRFERRLVEAHVEADAPLSPDVWRGVEAALVARPPRHALWLALGALVLAAAALVVALLPTQRAPEPRRVAVSPEPSPPPSPSPPGPAVLNAILQTRRPITFAITADAARIEVEPCGGRFVNLTALGGSHRELQLVEREAGRRVEARFDGGPVIAGGVVHLLVPADTRLVISTRTGPVVVRGLGGPMEIDTQSGDVQLDTAPRLDPDVAVTSDSGSIRWSGRCGRRCRVDARSRSGDVTLRAPSRAPFERGAARAESQTGQTSLQELECADPRCSSPPLPWRQPAASRDH
ncbi:MAG TPA: hypothetical protein VNO33_05635 [Kofleriaceae bacterium]|nr:hypothetical protein [Kofleriaceae bacterium]